MMDATVNAYGYVIELIFVFVREFGMDGWNLDHAMLRGIMVWVSVRCSLRVGARETNKSGLFFVDSIDQEQETRK